MSEINTLSIIITKIVCFSRWLPLFIHEVRRKDGKLYKAKSLFEFVLCIQALFRAEKNIAYQFLKDTQFLPIRNSLDRAMKTLQAQGMGHNPRKADIVSLFMEEELWCSGLLGDSTPRILLRSLVFVLGVNLGLRSGEHRLLRRPMFQVAFCIFKTACSRVLSFSFSDRR